jgi:predicted Zn-dependent protease
LDITIDVPSAFTIKEIPGSQEIQLEKKDKLINIHVFGTNRAYKNIEELLDDINMHNDQAKETSKQHVKINGLDCAVTINKYVNRPELNNKAYDCFINSNVFFSISTKSESLYSDLDQIASSFQYKPKHVFKTYHSNFLGITIDVPSNFTIKERLPEVLLENGNGVIIINEIGTNRSYKNIKEFLDESYKSNSLSKEITREQINIKGIDCEVAVEKYINQLELNNKAYYCYRNSNSFLSFSTTFPELYADLDKIVSSFHYQTQPIR